VSRGQHGGSARRAGPDFDALRLAAHIRRQELGLTLKALVARTELAESTVTGTLYGYHEGNVRTWWAIARALDMSFGDLMRHADQEGSDTRPQVEDRERH
jgi:transcriptional regulator with XRE-family HTH domain